MSKIKVMDFDLASKIAAGEVIENQASVVKELVENAIDAKATKIDIILINNGLQLIQVSDNGQGMDKEDILLSVKEHATSKLLSEYDLFNISSLGFRGEALASIKSIAKLEISSNDGQSQGYVYDVFNDQIKEGYHQQGSCISVYNIFYNVPARFKYLDSVKKELSRIIDIISRFALTYTNIAFSLINDDKVLLQTNGNDNILQVINSIYSLDVAKGMKELVVSNSDFKISGYISDKDITRSNKNNIHIFINKRLVFNKELVNAIINGYADYLMEKRYPIAFINIECDYQLIDVNVHPAKLEVRVSKIEELIELLETSINQVFSLARKQFIQQKKVVQPDLKFTYQIEVDEDEPINYPQDQVRVDFVSESVVEKPVIETNTILNNTNDNQELTKFETTNPKHDLVIEEELKTIQNTYQEPRKTQIVESYIHFNAIGQFNGSYLLASNESGLHIIDQHAAMERINYEKKLGAIDDIISKQELIAPIIIPLTFSEKLKVLEVASSLKSIGLELEESANNDLIVREIPLWIDVENANAQIQSAIDFVLEQNKIKVKDITKEALILASCKMSLKANTYLSIIEQQALLDQLVLTSNYDHCPHGRPIIISLSVNDIEKMFKRIV